VITGVGIGVVDVPQFRSVLVDEDVYDRFQTAEIDYCESRARPWECLAARAAAKQATARALGMDGTCGQEVELVRQTAGDVELHLCGVALKAAKALGATRWWVSISHTKNTALAVVVLESTDSREGS